MFKKKKIKILKRKEKRNNQKKRGQKMIIRKNMNWKLRKNKMNLSKKVRNSQMIIIMHNHKKTLKKHRTPTLDL